MFTKLHVKPAFYGLALAAATFGFGVTTAIAQDNSSAPQNPWVQTSTEDGSYCHMKFPAVRHSTLYSDNPQLKSRDSGDVVDYYGPCDHSPTGTAEVQSQRDELNLQWEMNYESGD